MTKTYIYVLKCPNSGDVRYVGKTVNLRRRYNCHYSPAKQKSYVWSWIKSLRNAGLKPVMEVIDECYGNNWVEKEQYWISFYKNSGAKLCNLTDGGEGILGCKRSEETKKKISLNNARGSQINKKVFQFDLKGNFLQGYDTPKIASEKTGVKVSKILRSCNGAYIRGGGFIWSFTETTPLIFKSPKRKPVIQYDINMNIIKEYDSVSIAAKCIGSSTTNISYCCSGKIGFKTVNGFIFKHKII